MNPMDNTEILAAGGATGVIGAMDNEIALLRESMRIDSTETITGMTFYAGSLNGHPMVLVQCGVGKVSAAVCAQTLILRYGVKRVINVGVAGSLDKHVNVGDIVISADVVQHDFDTGTLAVKNRDIPATQTFHADADLRKRALEAAKKVAAKVQTFEGRVCSGDQFIAGQAKKKAITDRFGGFCCEMEGAAIAQTCTMNDVPFVIIRAISDKADDSGEISFAAFANAVARRSAAIVGDMLENY